jgi:bifunctional DNA-binding transcriptional regulator/antitoxin component of YhaV-PrlF toxin-antitoxin module
MKVRLRANNQLTLPKVLATRLGIGPGDHLIVALDDADPDVIQLRPLRKSYAGVAADIYGRTDDIVHYLQEEQAAWETTEDRVGLITRGDADPPLFAQSGRRGD